MKKVAFFLLIILIFCLSSCGEDKSSKTSEDSSSDVVLKQDKESSVEDASSTIEEKSEEISEDPSTLPSYFLLSKIETKVSSGTNKTEMKYNEDGLIIENVSYAKGKLSTKYTYEYNDNGILIVEAHYAYDNSGNVFYYTKNTYSHDEDGVLKSCELDENGDLYTISYEYDSEGRLSSSLKSNKDGEIILRTEYNYLENNEGYTKINYTPDGLQKEVYDKNENMIDNAAKVGAYLFDELKKIDGIKEVRGRGLMIGVEFEQPIKEIRNDRLLMQQHVFTGVAGTNTIRLLPPLCLSMDDAKEFVCRFKKCI